MNTIGRLLQLHSWGESHGNRIGAILDGVPSGIVLDLESIQQFCDRRKPGQSDLTTPRKETDIIHIDSGLYDGKTTGMPIAYHFENKNIRSVDYDHLKDVYRPGHADQTYAEKYGHRDHRGGGRSSARETANWVAAGAIAKHIIPSIKATAWVDQVGHITMPTLEHTPSQTSIEANALRCPDENIAAQMRRLIEDARQDGDSLGGVISCRIDGVPDSLGEPVFDKLHARLAHAMMTINAVKGFEYGAGFAAASMRGTTHNDVFDDNGTLKVNNSGGIVGGISNGQTINFRVAFKPVASVSKEQTMPTTDGGSTKQQIKGRHDPCVVPRAVPIVEAMAYLVLADLYLLSKA
jgi:chorismate synthase